MRSNVVVVLSAVIMLGVLGSVGHAQRTEWALSVGYGHLSIEDAGGAFGEQDGLRLEPRFSWQPFEQRPQVRFGIGVGFSFYFDEEEGIPVPPPFVEVDSYENAGLITPEFQLSWRQPMSKRWWIEGGLGMGPAIGIYTAGDVVFDDFFDEDVRETDVGLGVRPFARAGFRGSDERWSWGVEASYQWTDVDFGRPYGGDVSEWYVGLFFSFGK
jgi:hypothetical protein